MSSNILHNHFYTSPGSDAYDYVGLQVNFYRSPNLETVTFSSYDLADNYINNNAEKSILILHRELVLNYKFSNFNSKPVYTILPEWILDYNINDWQSRADLYSIYLLEYDN